MTHSRKSGQHVYDLTERVVPPAALSAPELTEDDSIRGLIAERARSTVLLPLVSPVEVWSMPPSKVSASRRNELIKGLVDSGKLAFVDLDGVRAVTLPHFLDCLATNKVNKVVHIIAPLDQFMWNRALIRHLFEFDYLWEVYVPEAKRRWGYYVLPVLFGDRIVARFDVWCRKGILEVRSWHWESERVPDAFWDAFESAWGRFMAYAGAHSVQFGEAVDPRIQERCSATCRKQ